MERDSPPTQNDRAGGSGGSGAGGSGAGSGGNRYDALIVGGGPAGLSAAIYLGRFRRSVLVLDAGEGRSSFWQINENYLGFPNGVTTRDLRDLGRAQAERFGAQFKDCSVERVEQRGDQDFVAHTTAGDYRGSTVLFATGVQDVWPDIPGIEQWIGRQVFWCITCDGHRTVDRTVVCIGNDDEAATTALQFLTFTTRITLVADPDKERFSEKKRRQLAAHNIPVVSARAESLEISPDGGGIRALCLSDGTRLPVDMLFSLLGVRPSTQMAREMGVALDDHGYILIDEEGYTSIPGVFAAGDLTGMYTQQVASAVHAGAEAAQTMNYYLYSPCQRNVGDENPVALSKAHDPAAASPS
jgi:thioredoxin reductase (NADPH)